MEKSCESKVLTLEALVTVVPLAGAKVVVICRT